MSEENKKTIKTATESLKLLWNKGFFKVKRKYSQIEKNLSQNGYHFSVSELGMALKRAKHLTRYGKRGNYEYIQKYPFTTDENKK